MRPVNQKRSRGRSNGRKPHGMGGGAQRNFDSNGPDVKIRGTAAHIFDRYCQLARDAHAAGDRIAAENYQQHAEHYYRIMVASGMTQQHRQQQGNPQQAQQFGNGGNGPGESGEGESGAEGDQPQPALVLPTDPALGD